MKKLSILIVVLMISACGKSGGDAPTIPQSSTPETPAAAEMQWDNSTWNTSKWK